MAIALLVNHLWPWRDGAAGAQPAAVGAADEAPVPLVAPTMVAPQSTTVAARVDDALVPGTTTSGPMPADATAMDPLLAPIGSYAPAVRVERLQ